MNSKKISFVFVFCIFCSLSLDSCTKEASNIIEEIDAVSLFDKHLSDFTLIFEREWAWALDTLTEYLVKRQSDSANIQLRIGLYSNQDEAFQKLDLYLNDVSIAMKEGHPDGIEIGDKFYWWAGSPGADITNIMFVRFNAFFMMNSHDYGMLDSFALNIDQDILKRASYITFAD